MNDMIRTENLSKRFRSTSALNEATLAVPEGAVYALVGANGAGKTTLIKLLMNIFHPTSGHARVMGIECRHLAGKDFQRIGYVSENQDMPDWMTVEAMLDYLRPFYPHWDGALEQQLVRQFDLPLKRVGWIVLAEHRSLAWIPALKATRGLDPWTAAPPISASLPSRVHRSHSPTGRKWKGISRSPGTCVRERR